MHVGPERIQALVVKLDSLLLSVISIMHEQNIKHTPTTTHVVYAIGSLVGVQNAGSVTTDKLLFQQFIMSSGVFVKMRRKKTQLEKNMVEKKLLLSFACVGGASACINLGNG